MLDALRPIKTEFETLQRNFHNERSGNSTIYQDYSKTSKGLIDRIKNLQDTFNQDGYFLDEIISLDNAIAHELTKIQAKEKEEKRRSDYSNDMKNLQGKILGLFDNFFRKSR